MIHGFGDILAKAKIQIVVADLLKVYKEGKFLNKVSS